jgi:hypothetical protein
MQWRGFTLAFISAIAVNWAYARESDAAAAMPRLLGATTGSVRLAATWQPTLADRRRRTPSVLLQRRGWRGRIIERVR